MAETLPAAQDLSAHVRNAGPRPETRISNRIFRLQGSEILKISGEIRALRARGEELCDLTVGDFHPRHFPIPSRLLVGIRDALERGETNYPPSSGLVELRQAVCRLYSRELGLDYPEESVLIAGGSRPLIYGLYETLCEPGDRVIYPVPTWNNNHYIHLTGAVGVPVPCGPADRFMPTARALKALFPGARLLALNSPLNPAGTAISRDVLLGLCEAILDENRAREARGQGERPLYLMYDQIYWMLCFGATEHVTPPGLLPEMARYTVLVDGISKAFAATGLRVGWALGPLDIMSRMSALLGHLGAWAPRPEQSATVGLLDDPAGIREFHRTFKRNVEARLNRLHEGFLKLRAQGLPVDSIPPMGAIYLAARVHPFGLRTARGVALSTNEDIRRFLLEQAGTAVVPFQAFGAPADDGWFRWSVGAVSEAEIGEALLRVEAALRSLS